VQQQFLFVDFTIYCAMIEDFVRMRNIVGQNVYIKTLGDMRRVEDVAKLIETGATRKGASLGVKVIRRGP
jgi:deoxyribose-phosphate aldolase